MFRQKERFLQQQHTNLQQERQKPLSVRSKEYDNTIAEKLSYGLTDTVSLDATVANVFQKWKDSLSIGNWGGSVTDRDDKNIDFELGSTWNVLTGPAKVQVSGAYGQKQQP